jgi:hypothetical protein
MKTLFRPALFLALFFTFAANARALEVISARWGHGRRWADVRGAVAAQFARGHRSFEASNDTFGVDPAKGDSKVLEVVYADRSGRTYQERVKEGDTFRFRVEERIVEPPIVVERGGPRLGFRIEDEGRAPVVAGAGAVRIVNQFPHTIRLFTVSRDGGSRLVATLAPGDRITPDVRPRPDRRWIVTTTDGIELRRFNSGLDGGVIVLR